MINNDVGVNYYDLNPKPCLIKPDSLPYLMYYKPLN